MWSSMVFYDKSYNKLQPQSTDVSSDSLTKAQLRASSSSSSSSSSSTNSTTVYRYAPSLAPFPLNFPLSLRVQLCMCMHRSSVGPQGLVIPCLVSSPVHEDPRLCRVRATRMTLRMLQLRHRSLFDQLLKIDMMLVLNLPCLLH